MINILRHISRFILGIIFLVAGINGYFVIFGLEPFIETSEPAMQLFQFTYLLVVEKSVEVACGLLLIVNRYIPLSLAVLSPIVANILLLHIFLDHSLLPLAILIVICHSFLLLVYRKNFIRLLERKPL